MKTILDLYDSSFSGRLSNATIQYIDALLESKSISPLKVMLAGVTAKIQHPEWDTRKHQTQLGGKMSLRGFDSKWVSRPLYMEGLVHQPTPGALTRSLEKPEPYTLEYSGKVKPHSSKVAFLHILDKVNREYNERECIYIISYAISKLREHSHSIQSAFVNHGLGKDASITLHKVQLLLHDILAFTDQGSSIIPVCVLHSYLKATLDASKYRVEDLKCHTTSDIRSNSLGDIEVYDTDGDNPHMVIEVKHSQFINDEMDKVFHSKTHAYARAKRYIVTTHPKQTPNISDNGILHLNIEHFIIHDLFAHQNAIDDFISILIRSIKESAMHHTLKTRVFETIKNYTE